MHSAARLLPQPTQIRLGRVGEDAERHYIYRLSAKCDLTFTKMMTQVKQLFAIIVEMVLHVTNS